MWKFHIRIAQLPEHLSAMWDTQVQMSSPHQAVWRFEPESHKSQVRDLTTGLVPMSYSSFVNLLVYCFFENILNWNIKFWVRLNEPKQNWTGHSILVQCYQCCVHRQNFSLLLLDISLFMHQRITLALSATALRAHVEVHIYDDFLWGIAFQDRVFHLVGITCILCFQVYYFEFVYIKMCVVGLRPFYQEDLCNNDQSSSLFITPPISVSSSNFTTKDFIWSLMILLNSIGSRIDL